MLDKSDFKLSWFEIIFVIGAVAFIDFIEAWVASANVIPIAGTLFDLIISGIIDIFTGFGLFMYCYIRGIRLGFAQIISLLLGFLFELIPAVGGFPLWTLDAAFILLMAKKDDSRIAEAATKIIGKLPVKNARAKIKVDEGRRAIAGGQKPPPLPKEITPSGPMEPKMRVAPPRPGSYVSGKGISELQDDRDYIRADIEQFGQLSHSVGSSEKTPPSVPKTPQTRSESDTNAPPPK